MKYREVKFYKTAEGKKPVKEFLDSLDGKVAQKIVWTLKLVEELERIPTTYLKNITGTEFYEVRVIFSGNIYRILGFFHAGNFLMLTNGFQKKTQKTPKNEIDICKERMKDFYDRGGEL